MNQPDILANWVLRLFKISGFHVLCVPPDMSIYRCDIMMIEGVKRCEPKITWREVSHKILNLLERKKNETWLKIKDGGSKKFHISDNN